MSKKTQTYRKPVKTPSEPETLKEATFPIRHIDQNAIERYMAENFGMSATPVEDLPENKPTEEYLIEFKGVQKK